MDLSQSVLQIWVYLQPRGLSTCCMIFLYYTVQAAGNTCTSICLLTKGACVISDNSGWVQPAKSTFRRCWFDPSFRSGGHTSLLAHLLLTLKFIFVYVTWKRSLLIAKLSVQVHEFILIHISPYLERICGTVVAATYSQSTLGSISYSILQRPKVPRF